MSELFGIFLEVPTTDRQLINVYRFQIKLFFMFVIVIYMIIYKHEFSFVISDNIIPAGVLCHIHNTFTHTFVIIQDAKYIVVC